MQTYKYPSSLRGEHGRPVWWTNKQTNEASCHDMHGRPMWWTNKQTNTAFLYDVHRRPLNKLTNKHTETSTYGLTSVMCKYMRMTSTSLGLHRLYIIQYNIHHIHHHMSKTDISTSALWITCFSLLIPTIITIFSSCFLRTAT